MKRKNRIKKDRRTEDNDGTSEFFGYTCVFTQIKRRLSRTFRIRVTALRTLILGATFDNQRSRIIQRK